MAKKNYRKSARDRSISSKKLLHKYASETLQPSEFSVQRGVGFREQVNLYWQKRNADKLKWKKIHAQNNSNK
jgi:hypothetical protein